MNFVFIQSGEVKMMTAHVRSTTVQVVKSGSGQSCTEISGREIVRSLLPNMK